ncbi:hypothetical protein CCP4SC76_2020035 [Gammaproteobacteria bacterium]
MHWTTRIDELIEAGQDATREENAETLERLLSLTPDDRWRLLQSRDPCLNRLTADGYQDLLNQTVEARTSAILPVLPPLNPPGALDHSDSDRRSRDRGLPDRRQTAVTPGSTRRHSSLEDLVKLGWASDEDTDTLTDLIH